MTRVADILVIVGLVFVAWYQINAGLQFVFVSFFNLLGVDLRTWSRCSRWWRHSPDSHRLSLWA